MWNVRFFETLSKYTKNNLEKEILRAYNECKLDLEKLKRKKLSKLNFNKNGNLIKRIFSTFSIMPSIRYTGAAKILHILNPNVFMMWDLQIRRAYFKINTKIRDPAKFYLKFLQKSKKIIEAILKLVDEETLWLHHLEFIDKSFAKNFSFSETILKMLDECNYLKFNQNIVI